MGIKDHGEMQRERERKHKAKRNQKHKPQNLETKWASKRKQKGREILSITSNEYTHLQRRNGQKTKRATTRSPEAKGEAKPTKQQIKKITLLAS